MHTLMRSSTTRSALAAVAATALGVAAIAATDAPPKTDELVVVSWGGSYQEAQRAAYFSPFAAATGIRVLEDTGPQIDRSRAEVESGSPSYDLTATNQAFYEIGLGHGLWVPIDYGYFDEADLEAMPDEVRLSHGVGTIYYGEGIAISLEAFPEDGAQPNSWADVWDVERFPGKRALPWCDVATYPLPEAALLSLGVDPEDLYPIDIERAAERLAEIYDDTIWWQDINQAGQLLATGEAVIAMAPSGRVQRLIDDGAPLEIVWNESRYTFDVWYVLRRAPNIDNAMRFIAFASQPEQQAEMARQTGYAPTNPRALELLDDEEARKLPTHPDNIAGQFRKNEEWWREHREDWVRACTQALL